MMCSRDFLKPGNPKTWDARCLLKWFFNRSIPSHWAEQWYTFECWLLRWSWSTSIRIKVNERDFGTLLIFKELYLRTHKECHSADCAFHGRHHVCISAFQQKGYLFFNSSLEVSCYWGEGYMLRVCISIYCFKRNMMLHSDHYNVILWLLFVCIFYLFVYHQAFRGAQEGRCKLNDCGASYSCWNITAETNDMFVCHLPFILTRPIFNLSAHTLKF